MPRAVSCCASTSFSWQLLSSSSTIEVLVQMSREIAASSPAPSMRVDLRRRMNGRPITYRPGASDDSAVVADASLAVEHRQVEPGIVRPIARRPNRPLQSRRDQIQAELRLGLDTRSARTDEVPRNCSSIPVAFTHVIYAGQKPIYFQIGERTMISAAIPRTAPCHRKDRLDGPRARRPALRSLFRSTVTRSGVPMS